MNIIKTIILLLIFLNSLYIGYLISKKYINRVNELKEIKNALNIFKTKIKFTYETIPNIFRQISDKTTKNVSFIFKNTLENMKDQNIGDAWKKSLYESDNNLNKEDIDALLNLGNLLRKSGYGWTSRTNKSG